MSRAALLAGGVLAALAPHAAHAQSGDAAAAQQRFTQGLELAERGDFPRALVEFRASLAAYNSPNARLYVARCLAQLGRRAEAADEYDRTARDAAAQPRAQRRRYAEARAAALVELRELDRALGRVRIAAGAIPPEARVRVGTREVYRSALAQPVRVEPGAVAIVVEAEGYRSERVDTSVSAGGEASVELPALHATSGEAVAMTGAGAGNASGQNALPPPPPPPSGPRAVWPDALAIAGGAVAVGGFVSFGVLYSVTNQRYQELFMRCGGVRCPQQEREAVEGGQALQTWTNVSLGIGIVGAVVGTSMFIYGRLQRPAPAHSAPVQVSVTGTGVAVSGVF